MTNRVWQVLGIITILALAIVYKNTMQWEWAAWWREESEYSHGILVPFICGFLIWLDGKRISKVPVRPNLLGALVILPMILVQFAGHRSAGLSMAGMTIPFVVAGMSLMLFGWQATKVMWFPLAFLTFMCVPPASIITQLSHDIQMASTVLATAGLKVIGFNAMREGTFIVFGSGFKVEVAAACSGIRTLVMLLAFASVLAYVLDGPIWKRLSIVAIVPPVALITNSVRVFVVALVGENMGHDAMKIAHDQGGYVIVFISMYLLYVYAAKVVKCRDFRFMP